MAGMHTTVSISRPLPEVFDFFLAPDLTATQVDPAVESVRREPPGPPAPGTTFRFRLRAAGPVRETTTRFTRIDPNRCIAFEGQIGPMRPACMLTFGTTDAGTTVTFSGHARPVGPLRVLCGRFDRRGQTVWTDRLARIKALLETA